MTLTAWIALIRVLRLHRRRWLSYWAGGIAGRAARHGRRAQVLAGRRGRG
jgi:hypothetical protein